MRNGNPRRNVIFFRGIDGSYRTYEEWKREQTGGMLVGLMSSYRTYEEWKQLNRLW